MLTVAVTILSLVWMMILVTALRVMMIMVMVLLLLLVLVMLVVILMVVTVMMMTCSLDGESARFSLGSNFIHSIAEKLSKVTLPE